MALWGEGGRGGVKTEIERDRQTHRQRHTERQREASAGWNWQESWRFCNIFG